MKLRLALLLVALLAPVFFVVPTYASVDDFTISNYTIDYLLSRDAEGRSVLKTVETITAEFPDFDQNHGIERAVPLSYNGHTTNLAIDSVQHADGSSWNYTTYTSNDNAVIRIGDAATYVHGEQTYVITYTQHDVTNYFTNTNDDEFYWDTNGTEWRIPITHLSVVTRISDGLQAALNGNTSCYVGFSGSNQPCQITQDGSVFTVSADNLAAGENVTTAIGFRPNTFTPYQQTTWEKFMNIFKYVWSVLVVVGFAAIFWVPLKWSSAVSRKKEIGTVVPEYIPPKDVSVTTAADVLRSARSTFAAQLIDFAVRHYLKLYEIEKSGFLGLKSKDYEIEVVKDVTTLKAEEQEILSDIFGHAPMVGQKLKLSKLKNNTAVYNRTTDNTKKLKVLVRGEYGLREKNQPWTRRFRKIALWLFVLGVATLNPFVGFAAIFAFVSSFTVWSLTDKGLELSRYLQGLKLYIDVAEKDRIKMLQSPEGAAKISGLDPTDNKQLIKLYERVLPYAVLFGQEKEWNKQIGRLYEDLNQNPDWYVGRSAFTAAAFSNAMSSFSTSASYSAASSSSSGGSSGGGSSGGGGGGGGGGGW